MMRFRNIGLLILLLLAGRMAAQVPVLDSVCQGADRFYRVDGEAGSTYSWILTWPDATVELLPSDADTVQVTWNYLPGTYLLETVQHSEDGCDADTVSGQVIIFKSPVVFAGPNGQACATGSYHLVSATAEHTSSLLWSTGGDGTFDDVTLLNATYTPGPADVAAGTVTLTLTGSGLGDEGTCDPAVSTIELTILLEITPEFDPIGPLCLNSIPPALPVTSNNGVTGSWDPPLIDTGIPGTSTYVFTPDDGQCATAMTMTVEIAPLPAVFAGADQTIPGGASTTIGDATASGAEPLAFSWEPAGLLVNPNVLNPVTVNLNVTTTFTLMVTDGNGCVSSDEVIIIVTGGPLAVNPTAEPDEICFGESAQLYANASGGSGTYNYSWTSNPPGFTFDIANPLVSPAVTTIFTVEVDDGFSIATASVTITVNPLPEVTCPEDLGLCIDAAPFALTGAVPEGGTYSGPGVNGGVFDPMLAGVGTREITYSYTDGNGCTNTCTFIITVNALPYVNAGADQTIPGGTSTIISDATAAGAEPLAFSWEPAGLLVNPNVLNPTTVNLDVTTTFTLTVTDANGCVNSDQVTIIVTGGPLAVNPTAEPDEICPGEPAQLYANASGGSGIYNYSWTSDPPGFVFSGADPVVSPLVTTIYTVEVNDGQNTAEGSVTVTVLPDNTIILTSASGTENQVVCINTPIDDIIYATTGATGAIISGLPAGVSGSWAPGVVTISGAPAVSGIFLYTVTTTGGCGTATAFGKISVTEVPGVSCPGDFAVCCNSWPVNLAGLPGVSPAGGTFYLGGQPVTMFMPDCDLPGEFDITYEYTDGNGCTGSCTFTITVNALPEVYAGADQAIASGTSATMGDATASGVEPLTYSWLPAALLINPNMLNPTTVDLDVTTIFTLRVTDAGGCVNSDQVTIYITGGLLTVNPVAEPAEVCMGETSQLSANAGGGSGNYNYSWTSDPPGFVFSGADPVVSPLVTTIYTVEVNDGFSATTGSVTVTVNALPEVSCPEDFAVCCGTGVITLASLPGVSPEGGTFWINGQPVTEFTPDCDVTSEVTVTYSYTDANGCTNSCVFTVTMLEKPQVTGVQTNAPHCNRPDGQIMISAFSPSGLMLEYSIDDGNSYFSDSLFANLPAGVYTVRIRDINGCDGFYDDNHPIILNDIPGPQVTQTNITNETDGLGNGAIEIIATGSTPQLLYSNDNGVNWQTGNGLFENLSAGIYPCLVRDENNCDTSFMVVIQNYIITPLEAIVGPGDYCLGNAAIVPLKVDEFHSVAAFQLKLSYNADNLMCEGYTNAHPQLANNLTGWIDQFAGIITLQWQSNVPVTFTQIETVAELVFTTKQGGQGELEWYTGATESYFTDLAGSPIPAEFSIGELNIYNPPVIILSDSKTVCEGQMVAITGIASSTQPPVSYQWIYPDGQTQATDPFFASVTQADAGDYTLLATDAMGCTDQKTIRLVVNENPVAAFHGTDTLTVPAGYILDAGTGLASYLWNTGETTESITVDTTGWYWVELVSQVECTGIDSIYILISGEIPPECLYVPNAFTPNGDGQNDTFMAKARDDCFSTFNMLIFNRWGEELFESDDISIGWDGTKNGVPCPGDAYVYKITYKAVGDNGAEEEKVELGVVIIVK